MRQLKPSITRYWIVFRSQYMFEVDPVKSGFTGRDLQDPLTYPSDQEHVENV